MNISLKNRHFLTLLDYSSQEIDFLLSLAYGLKAAKRAGTEQQRLKGKNIALIFEKPSTRTRCAFEVAAYDQGAHVTYIGPDSSQINLKETIKDTARVLGRMYDGIEYRGFEQAIVAELAKYAGVPVWNGLTNEDHPTQALADLMTMQEHSQKELKNISFCYVGNAHNNTSNALMIAAVQMGMDFRIAAPSIYHPDLDLVEKCQQIAAITKATLTITEDMTAAVKNVDFLHTDVWLSMGEAEALWQERIKLLQPYQVNQKLLALTGNPNVKFMHCLPAIHNRDMHLGEKVYQAFGLEGVEVTEDVFESKHSIVFDQAENRLHTIKSIMVATLGGA